MHLLLLLHFFMCISLWLLSVRSRCCSSKAYIIFSAIVNENINWPWPLKNPKTYSFRICKIISSFRLISALAVSSKFWKLIWICFIFLFNSLLVVFRPSMVLRDSWYFVSSSKSSWDFCKNTHNCWIVSQQTLEKGHLPFLPFVGNHLNPHINPIHPCLSCVFV